MLNRNRKFEVLYVDPPWSYKNKRTGGSAMISGAEAKYSTMSIEELCAMRDRELRDIVAKDAVLFMWATNPLLEDAFSVINYWGFKYKTTIVWKKVMSLGMGFWWRGQTEFLLFATKGKVKAFRMQEKNIIECKVGKHSEKPEEFRQLINRATIGMPNKLELFARKNIEGWSCWGNEIVSDVVL